MSLEVRDLRLVQAVARQGSLTKAGAVLNLTQSALSHQLASLERRLGSRVFAREAKRLVLTPAGASLLDAAERLLASLQQAETDARRAGTGRRDALRFSTQCYTAYHWLPRVVRAYREQFPHVEPQIVGAATRNPLPALLAEQLDVAVISALPRQRSVAVTELFTDELVAIVPPDHEWARRPFVTSAEFAQERLFVYGTPPTESMLFRLVLTPAGVRPREVSRVDLTEAMVELVKAGLGVAVLARWAVAPHLRSGVLCAVSVTEARLTRTWRAAVLRRHLRRRHVKAFVQLLAQHLHSLGRASTPGIAGV
jgi:LysR family transcriptional regulator for metE and metH